MMLTMQPGPLNGISALFETVSGYHFLRRIFPSDDEFRAALRDVCPGRPSEPKRTPNAYVLFRSMCKAHGAIACDGPQQRFSRIVGAVWSSMPSAQKAFFEDEALRRRVILKVEHPTFKWNALRDKGEKVAKKQGARKGISRARPTAAVRSPVTPAPVSRSSSGFGRGPSMTPSCCTPALSPSGSSVYEYTPRSDSHALPSARWTRDLAPVMPPAMMPQLLAMQEKPFGYDDLAQMVAIGEDPGPLAYRPQVEYGPSVNMLGLNGVQDFPTATIGLDTQLQYTPSPSPLPLGDVVSWTPEQAAIGLSFFPQADFVAEPSTPTVPTASQDFPTATAGFDTQDQLTPCPSPLPLDEIVHWTPEQVAIGLSFFPDADTVAGPSAQAAHTAPHPAPEPQAERSDPVGPSFAPTPSLLLDQPVFPTSEIGWNLEGFNPQPASFPAQEASEAVQPGLEENWLNLERCTDEPVVAVAGPSNRDPEWRSYLPLAQRAMEGQERTRRAYHPYRYPYHQQTWWHRGYY